MAESILVAETFTFADSDGNSLSKLAKLDTCVTVVDSYNFLLDFNSKDSLVDRGQVATETDERTVTDLLVDQIEFADVIILNKTDLVTTDQLVTLENIIKKLNPEVTLINLKNIIKYKYLVKNCKV